MNFNFELKKIDNLIKLAIQEDIFTGDITSNSLIFLKTGQRCFFKTKR